MTRAPVTPKCDVGCVHLGRVLDGVGTAGWKPPGKGAHSRRRRYQGPARHADTVMLCASPFEQRTNRFHRGVGDETRAARSRAEHDASPHDARHVEQVIDDVCPGDLSADGAVPPSGAPLSGSVDVRLSMCATLRMGARGLRSSCPRMARKSSLRRSASRSARSARLRADTSSTRAKHPRTLPSAPRSGM